MTNQASDEGILLPFEVDISPEMQLYKILQRQSYGIDTALAEFVDNSIQSFIDRKKDIQVNDKGDPKLNIQIIVDKSNKQIIIEDNAGGINRQNFQRAIKMGGSDERSHESTSLSVYGIGMKSAAIWFSDTWKVETSSIGSKEKLSTTFDLNELLSQNKSKILVNSKVENQKNHYTRIIIENSLRDFDENFFKHTVLAYLQETFLKFKDYVDIEIKFDGLVLHTDKAFLQTPDPLFHFPVDKHGEPVEGSSPKPWKKRINIDYAGRQVKGFIMIMSKGRYKHPGIRLLRNNRVISGTLGGDHFNKPEILFKTSNKFSAQRIYGEIALNNFPVNFTKTGFDENLDGLYQLLQTELTGNTSSEDYIHQSEYYRARKSTSTKTTTSKKPSSKPKSPPSSGKTPERIAFSQNMHDMLSELRSQKHVRLYTSICNISLVDHPVLAYVGSWVLLESLATYLGKKPEQAFDAFYNQKIDLFMKKARQRSEYKLPIKEIHSKGNLNKHSGNYEAMNAKQLISDFLSIEPFLILCIEEIIK